MLTWHKLRFTPGNFALSVYAQKNLLNKKGVDYKEYPIDGDPEGRLKMSERAGGRTTVPQIFINEKGIGGCDELYALEDSHQLDSLLN